MKIKKVFMWAVACLVLFSTLLPFTENASAQTAGKATVNADSLNVREKASTASKKIGSLKRGATVEVYANLTGGWSQINFNKKKAYVSTAYLTPIPTVRTAKVVANPSLNVREKASDKSKKVGSLKYGTTVQVQAMLASGWAEIKYNNKKAYVSNAYLSYTTDAAPVTYKKDPSKVYQFKSLDGIHTYKSNNEKYNGSWIIWYGTGPGYQQTTIEQETKDALMGGWPNASTESILKYPVKAGTTWVQSYDTGETAKILSVNKSVTTLAGTYKNVVEVQDSEGALSYYAPNVGFVKKMINGKVLIQLSKVTNK
ncbi:SH3 domain-containing protein [Bacillus sp. 1P06AnD]|uniref:SH3 domain-containing protein n=1 Tax=Bacillus sp. 1P06AnD TaxID=3132208 RepID=UPI0039A3F705